MGGWVLIVSLSNDFVFDYQKIIIFGLKWINMCQIVRLFLINFAPKLFDKTFKLNILMLMLLFHLMQLALELMQFFNRLAINLLVALILFQQISV